MISLSVVSHNQGSLVNNLLDSLSFIKTDFEVIVTSNTYEETAINLNRNYPCTYIQNKSPKGFGRNHNFAFSHTNSNFFCVLNPDILFFNDVFPSLLNILQNKSFSLVAPIIVDRNNEIDDNYRSFLTPKNFFLRLLKLEKNNPYSYKNLIYPDWIAGMFMMFRSIDFRKVGGFNEAYFMYCEDMDICFRMKTNNFNFVVDSSERVLHDARRASRSSLKHTYWHIKSIILFWFYFFHKFK